MVAERHSTHGCMNPLRLAALDASPFCSAKGGGLTFRPVRLPACAGMMGISRWSRDQADYTRLMRYSFGPSNVRCKDSADSMRCENSDPQFSCRYLTISSNRMG